MIYQRENRHGWRPCGPPWPCERPRRGPRCRANRRACRIVCEATDNPKVPEGLVAPPPPVPLPPEMEARRQELAKAAALEAKLKVQAAKAASDAAKAKARAETIAAAEAARVAADPARPARPSMGDAPVESRKRPTMCRAAGTR